jgi:hypothetical protein
MDGITLTAVIVGAVLLAVIVAVGVEMEIGRADDYKPPRVKHHRR